MPTHLTFLNVSKQNQKEDCENPMTQDEFNKRRRFIVKLGYQLHQYGTPAYGLEAHLLEVTDLLNVKGSFIATPTSLTFVIWTSDRTQEYNYTERVLPTSPNLGALARTHELVEQLFMANISIQEAEQQLSDIANAHRFSTMLECCAFTLSGGAFSMLMRSSLFECMVASFLSFLVFLLVLWSRYSKRIEKMLDPIATLVAAVVAATIDYLVPLTLNVELAILASVIVFIPGLSLTVGLNELSARHLISGTAKIMDAMMQMFKLYFGAFLGLAIMKLALPSHPAQWTNNISFSVTPLDVTFVWLAIGILCGSLVVIFHNRLQDAVFAILAGYVAYGSSILAANYVDVRLSAFFGALFLGLYCNSFTWLRNAPTAVISLHGLVVLVPGSKIFMGLNSFLNINTLEPINNIGQQTFLILMSLVAGFIFANVLLPQKKSL